MKKIFYTLLLLFPLLASAQKSNEFKRTVPVEKTTKSEVNLKMLAGELQLNTGTTHLLDAQVNYTNQAFKPTFSLNRNNSTSVLTLQQPKKNINSDNDENNWKVNLHRSTPLSLSVELGAGEAQLDLSNSRIQKLEVEAGAVSCHINLSGSTARQVRISAGVGELNLDLTGNWKNDLEADLTGGIGEINIKVPRNTGVRIDPSGLGDLDLKGFKKVNGYYQNSAYGKSKHSITLNVSGGIGDLTVTQE